MKKNKIKIFLGRKVTQLSATFFALLLVVSACKKDETNIGGDLQDGELGVVKTDTFTIVTYTEEYDSLETDETSVGLIGAYHDPIFGGVNCGVVTQIVPENLNPVFPSSGLVLDSVVLALRYTSISYYANLADIDLEVYEIDDVLTRDDQEYYSFDDPTIIGDNLVLAGSETVSPDPVLGPTLGTDTVPSPTQVRLQLDPSFGLDLIADAASGLLNANFQNTTFKGLYIKATVNEALPDFGIAEGQGTVLYFSMEDILTKLVLYYRVDGGATESFDFDINSTCARYNKIEYDRDGTAIQAALDAEEDGGAEAFYMQGGAMRAVVQLPYITQFYTDVDGNYDPKIINRAQLILPIQDFAADVFDPATRLFIARITGEKLSDFTADYGFGSSLEGNTVTYDEDAKEFRFTMTREIQALLNGDSENVGYRIYAPAFFGSTVERIIFNGASSSLKDKPRLEITYTEY